MDREPFHPRVPVSSFGSEAGLVLLTVLLLVPSARAVAPGELSRLAAEAEAIAIVEIFSTDYTAALADGPVYVEARVRKAVSGRLWRGQQIRFGASAWVGPTFKAGEERIVFLDALPARHAYYSKARWASLDAGKIDLFIAPEAVEGCTMAALTEYLEHLESATSSLRIEHELTRAGGGAYSLSIRLINQGDEGLSLRTSAMGFRWETAGVWRSLPVTWSGSDETDVVALGPGASLSGNASLNHNDVRRAREIAVSFSNQTAAFPALTWLGIQAWNVAVPY